MSAPHDQSEDEMRDLMALASLGFGRSPAGPDYSSEDDDFLDDPTVDIGPDFKVNQTNPKKKTKKKKHLPTTTPATTTTTTAAAAVAGESVQGASPSGANTPAADATSTSSAGRRASRRAAASASSSGTNQEGVVTVGGTAPGFPITESEEQEVKHMLNQVDFIRRIGPYTYEIKQGHVQGQRVPARFFASPKLLELITDEVQASGGSFTVSVQQLCNVATLPGILSASVGMPDLHSGYGFAIGNVAAMDMNSSEAVVSPGGVGFDINCGVRLLRTKLKKYEVLPVKEQLADALFKAVPVGVGSEGSLRLSTSEMDKLLEQGMGYTEAKGFSWPGDREVTEEGGCFPGARAAAVSSRAKTRGQNQCGTLGSGNHYCEVQVVDEVYDPVAASAMGLDEKGTIVIMIHSGSRGLGHQVCTDYLIACEHAAAKSGLKLVDRQLSCAPLSSQEGQDYLAAMAAAANYAFANRSLMAHQVRSAFSSVFGLSPEELGLDQVYDVSHNIAKVEEHVTEGGDKVQVLVHRKGATRSFPPGHPAVPAKYRAIGQPVLIGGSMGSASYVLTGGPESMRLSFGSTCHGAGRAMSRSQAMREVDSKQVLRDLSAAGITTRIATKKLAAEESVESYKDVSQVVHTCHEVGLSRLCVKLKPLIVVKG